MSTKKEAWQIAQIDSIRSGAGASISWLIYCHEIGSLIATLERLLRATRRGQHARPSTNEIASRRLSENTATRTPYVFSSTHSSSFIITFDKFDDRQDQPPLPTAERRVSPIASTTGPQHRDLAGITRPKLHLLLSGRLPNWREPTTVLCSLVMGPWLAYRLPS